MFLTDSACKTGILDENRERQKKIRKGEGQDDFPELKKNKSSQENLFLVQYRMNIEKDSYLTYYGETLEYNFINHERKIKHFFERN